MATTEQKILKMREVRNILNLGNSEIYKLIAEGKLKCARRRPKGERIFSPDEIQRYLDSLFGEGS